MDQNIKKTHPPAFREKVAIEAIKEAETPGQLASRFAIHPIQVGVWKKAALSAIHQFFAQGNVKAKEEKEDEREELYKKIGRLEVENDFLKKRWACLSNMNNLTPHMITTNFIDPMYQNLSLTKQTELLGVSRGSLYYEPVPIDPQTLELMNRIDKIHTDWPVYGARKIVKQIIKDNKKEREAAMKKGLIPPEEIIIGRKRVRTLMQEMGIEAVYQKPHLSRNNKPHPVYPYLLKGITASFPNHIWGADITYIKMHGGFLYLAAFLDWYSRFVVGWKLSTTLETAFVLEAANEALTIGVPEITNVDQGVQFTSEDFIGLWNQERTKISMDHQGRCFDNIFTERLWRTFKYEEVYLKDYMTIMEARNSIDTYFHKYNYERLHEALDYKTPAEVYFVN